jgi:hypothetical protein
MWTSRKARGQPKETTTVSTRPLIFSNTLSDENLATFTSPTSSSTGNGNNGFQYAPLDGFTTPANTAPTALPPYQEEPDNITRPKQTSTNHIRNIFFITDEA